MSIPESSKIIRVLVKYVNESEDIGEAVNRLMEISTVVNESGEITEFVNEDIEKLQKQVAEKLGYKLVDHRLELYGSKIKK